MPAIFDLKIFAENLNKHNPNLTIIGDYTGIKSNIMVMDVDGIIYNVQAKSLLLNSKPTIRTAIDKTKAFNILMQKIFPNLYIIDEYIVGNKKLNIYDELGNIFSVKPESILEGNYPSVASCIDKNKYFILKANLIHGNKYNYSLVKYIGNKKYVNIICNEHGVFKQKPNSHIANKQGCPKCNYGRGWSKSQWLNYTKNKICRLYIIRCWNNDEEFIKIGITSKSIKYRFRGNLLMPYNYEILLEISNTPEIIWNLEKEYHNNYKNYSYRPMINFRGIKECFKIEIINKFKYI